ncbi:MAG: T9SS type A sorting domain-containing protein [candidate division Zixibacteria bacterium]|nr:T9SS type A sorting domain-containing protein [candidate division Zixibacteria bacterium]
MKCYLSIYIVAMLFISVLGVPAYSQPDILWTKTCGVIGSGGYDLKITEDGGYIMVGDIDQVLAYVVRTDSLGDTLWTSTFGDSIYITANSICKAVDGYIFAGATGQSIYRDFYLIAISEDGDSLWSKTYDHETFDRVYSLATTSDGGYILVGTTSNHFYQPILMIKTNAQGDSLWARIHTLSEYDEARSVQQTLDGGYIMAGFRYVSGIASANLIKTDAEGELLWEVYEYDGHPKTFRSVKLTTDGGYIAAGFTEVFNVPYSYYKYYLAKYDQQGNKEWDRKYGKAPYYNWAYDVEQTNDGGYILAGYASDFNYSGDTAPFILRTNSDGDSLWSIEYFTPGSINPSYAVEIVGDHEFVVAGHFDYDSWLMKIREVPHCLVSMVADDEPPIYVPTGGSFSYTGSLSNKYDEPVINDVWVGVYYQGDFYEIRLFEGTEPVSPGDVITRHLTQNIPNYAPIGYYRYTAYCGNYPTVSDTAWLGFRVINSFPVIPDANRDWNVIETTVPDKIGRAPTGGEDAAVTPTGGIDASPNPFNASTQLEYRISESGCTKLEIFDILGRRIEVLVDEYKDAGVYSIVWNAEKYPSGIYFCRLTQGSLKATERIGLVK